MRVLRGRAETIDADRRVTTRLLEIAADGEPAVRVWTPHRQVAFGRRDRRLKGYDRARELADERGFPSVERDVGGRAVAYDGETTLAFARADPVGDFRQGTDERYERLTAAVERALSELDCETVRGEPSNAFCPGSHSISTRAAGGSLRKLVGLAQRVRQDAAVTAGIVLVDNRDELAAVLAAVYDELDVGFDPESVGTVAAADGRIDSGVVRARFEDALIGEEDSANVTVSAVT
ncbi:lipoyl protein ligase domain-containing protein [Natrialba aegyptia]|uniref:BPL/LPL catalytic domain-containing protein n=1 Tax=Natrialba aegyptia DSM 13077 TaxID=1227491 RepID=M0B8K2_9EURY|nr:lipoate--protein ligase family protein [Natrialba aegyptia]ELZ06832.1 hypothetical protein C480_07372 [Natrialba aegyptia DSM 13077]